jgi:hypothetical protein
MKLSTPSLAVISALLLLAGCATVPTGPSMMVLPGGSKSFDQFRIDDMDCRQYASYQISGNNPDQSSVDPGVRNAAIGTVIGALAGAIIGGNQGAGVGAGAGLVVGSMSGSEASKTSNYSSQRIYDNAYGQCMYGKGHQVPVSGSTMRAQPQLQSATPTPTAAPTAPAAYFPPPPPSGAR